jgi:glycosyltransferase involved in cell wall biosynthesis
MSSPQTARDAEARAAVVAVQIRDYAPVEPRLTAVPRPKVSVIIPAYNEDRRIAVSLAETWEYLERQAFSYEIIVSDDGSTDQTLAMANEFSETREDVCVVSIPHGGKAAAIRAGMSKARGDIVAFTS